jgi:hypothetical protein
MVEDDGTSFAFDIFFVNLAFLRPWLLICASAEGVPHKVSNVQVFREEVQRADKGNIYSQFELPMEIGPQHCQQQPHVYNSFAERMRRSAVKWRLVVKFSRCSEVSERPGLKSMVSSSPHFNQMLELDFRPRREVDSTTFTLNHVPADLSVRPFCRGALHLCFFFL